MMGRFVAKVYYVFSVPVAIFFILSSDRLHPSYRMTWPRRLLLGLRFFWNTLHVRTGTSYKSHLAMALKLLETSPDLVGDVLECGTWKGGSAVNLSLVCRIVGRRLRIYDSFEGLPTAKPGDREAQGYRAGDYCGTLDEVRTNIERYGAIECCDFVQGWFENTLPQLNAPVVLAFLDVDFEDSLDTCVRAIWPNLVESGYVFIDEFVGLDYCALFYSEEYWRRHFGRTPPGLIGAGSGLPMGEYYLGPWAEAPGHSTWHANAAAWTRKDFSGVWTYYPQR